MLTGRWSSWSERESGVFVVGVARPSPLPVAATPTTPKNTRGQQCARWWREVQL